MKSLILLNHDLCILKQAVVVFQARQVVKNQLRLKMRKIFFVLSFMILSALTSLFLIHETKKAAVIK